MAGLPGLISSSFVHKLGGLLMAPTIVSIAIMIFVPVEGFFKHKLLFSFEEVEHGLSLQHVSVVGVHAYNLTT